MLAIAFLMGCKGETHIMLHFRVLQVWHLEETVEKSCKWQNDSIAI